MTTCACDVESDAPTGACGSCGSTSIKRLSLPRGMGTPCHACDAEVAPNARFCGACGVAMQSRNEAEATAAALAAVARRDLQELRKRLSSFGQRHQISAQLQQMRPSKTELSYLLLQHYAATLEEQLASPLAHRKEIEAFIQMLDATLRGDEETQKDAPVIYFEVEPTQPGQLLQLPRRV